MGGIYSPYRLVTEEKMLLKAKEIQDDIKSRKRKKFYVKNVKQKSGSTKVLKKYDRLLLKFGVKGLFALQLNIFTRYIDPHKESYLGKK